MVVVVSTGIHYADFVLIVHFVEVSWNFAGQNRVAPRRELWRGEAVAAAEASIIKLLLIGLACLVSDTR